MDPKIAVVALRLLERVDLKGSEVEAFLAVWNALLQVARPDAPTAGDGASAGGND